MPGISSIGVNVIILVDYRKKKRGEKKNSTKKKR
jgi:ACT domain-containing protein